MSFLKNIPMRDWLLNDNNIDTSRTSVDTSFTLDTRDDVLVPAHGLLLIGAHSLTSNLQGQLCHAVSQHKVQPKHKKGNQSQGCHYTIMGIRFQAGLVQ